MKVVALALVSLLAACNKSDSPPPKPKDPPKLSAAGDVTVPDGHEVTFSYAGTPVKLEWSWVDILYYEGKPAFRVLAEDRERPGSFSMAVHIPDGTKTFDHMKGTTVGLVPWSISFGNAPEMASGDGGTLQITEVTPTYIAGTFEAQSCKFASRPRCENVKQVTKGTFKAFRSALSDDAAFTRYTTQPPPTGP